jgi:N-acyl-D-amino-acid deacylase
MRFAARTYNDDRHVTLFEIASEEGRSMFDLIVRNGTVVDGTGAAPFIADIGVTDGKISHVGPSLENQVANAREVIDASGHTITPGFVDVHTHYDGQVTWDSLLEPSSAHGVTTVITGNCGVGFAPVRPGQREWLVQLMEGVEDIPGTALHEGIAWDWESFPEYLDAIEPRHWSMDVGSFIPHGALRGYVMGERGAANENATSDDNAHMAALVRDAIEAGAFGFSSSRTVGHKAADGRPVPGTYAAFDELQAIARAVKAGGGLLEFAPAALEGGDQQPLDEMNLMARLSRENELLTTFLLLQNRPNPTMWRTQLDAMSIENANGAHLLAQVAGRPFGVLIGFGSYHPFQRKPTFRALAAKLSFSELTVELRKPHVRDTILSEVSEPINPLQGFDAMPEFIMTCLDRLFPLGDDVNYEPEPSTTIGIQSVVLGIDPERLIYDYCCEFDGEGFLVLPFLGYADGNHDALYEMLKAPETVLGLADGGAHCRMICDASQPTSMLTHWIRDRTRGPMLDLVTAVKRQTSETAALVGLHDRGSIAIGKRADLNVIDLPALRLHRPKPVDDLPAGGRRILQYATGYMATIVHGTVTRREGLDTGARPGRLLRRH